MTALLSANSNLSANLVFVFAAVISIVLSQYLGVFSLRNLIDSTKDFWTILYDSKFSKAFIASFAVIICSELGDKTFFISAIMAMKNSRLTVFLSSMTANIVMNAISVGLGVITQFIPKYLISYLSISFFGFFGFKMIYESYCIPSGQTQEELEEAKNELKKLDSKENTENKADYRTILSKGLPFLSLAFIETFCLIFFAEWGDRSQISTIVLAATEDPTGVIIGSLFGYSVCTAIAVLGGHFMAEIISIKTITLVGGILFLVFAGVAIFFG